MPSTLPDTTGTLSVRWPVLPVLRELARTEIAAQLRDLATPCPDHGNRVQVRCPACVQYGTTLRCAAIAAGGSSGMPGMPPTSTVEAYDRHFTDDRPARPGLLRRALDRARGRRTT